jgi:prepilin-type N-terminal cleavage/methylation domain-containing protein/prepilin-type processing-associated H-X9-DG protein
MEFWNQMSSSRRLPRGVVLPGGSNGFSLIELLVTLALLVALYAMTMTRGAQSYQAKQKAKCQKNLQSIHLALGIYATDNKDVFPKVKGAASSEAPLSLLVPRSTTVTELFICPGSKDAKLPEGEPFAKGKVSYSYYMGLVPTNAAAQPLVTDWQTDVSPKRQGQRIFSGTGNPPGSNHDKYGGNLVFGDGHVEGSPPLATRDFLHPTNVVLLNPRK